MDLSLKLINFTLDLAMSSQDQMQEELKYVLTMFTEKRRNLDITKTPDVYIDQRSTPSQVQNWLKAKGFSER